MTSDNTLAIDIGGTFTDVVLRKRASGTLSVAKVLTRYPDPSVGVLEGVKQVLGEVCPGAIGRAIHGTTLVTNALIERRGAKTGLIATAGFRDALEIGREGRYDIYDLFLKLPEPLVERRLRLEVRERLYARGDVMTPLNEGDVIKACEVLREAKVRAVAIAFLHAYVNPDHERRAAEIVRCQLPDVAISVSHRVAAELREFERTSTTVANAYVQPLVEKYLERLARGLRKLGIVAPLHIMLSNGGSCSVQTAAQFPVRLVESGPCGGALAAAHYGNRAGYQRILAFDMGGTTAKAMLSENGAFPITTESEVARVYRFKRGSGLPLLVPVLDMIEIGAGGGSIAHTSELGLPAVGPESAGADPGPACYARCGRLPTVTDADLLLGYLSAEYFLGGQMALDVASAADAVDDFARSTALDRMRAAQGICDLVNENMANAARVHAAERGIDLSGYALVATGGAGPVHACGVAMRLGIDRVIVPPAAGVGSAYGLMLAPIAFDYVRSFVSRISGLDLDVVNALYAEMEDEGRALMREAGVHASEIRVRRTADMRYVGQGHEIGVPVPLGALTENSDEMLQAAFDASYRKVYGRICEGVAVEAIHWRVTVSGAKPEICDPAPVGEIAGDHLPVARRAVLFERREHEVAVYKRQTLTGGIAITGPAIIEEAESTTVLPPKWVLRVDDTGNLILIREGP